MCKYIKLDFAEFYPSISVELLKKSITFAKSIIKIEEKVIIIIKHPRKSLLFQDSNTWVKEKEILYLT